VDVVEEEHVEDLSEDQENEEDSKTSNGHKTALDWETSTARKILGLLSGALAYTATAHFISVWISFTTNAVIGSMRFLILIEESIVLATH
jgi:hypothetical protein